MFRAKHDSEQRKIRLPKRTAAPTKEYLQFILDQTSQYRGQEIEVSWVDSTAARQFSLVARLERDRYEPSWRLWQDNGLECNVVWSHETADIELINNMLSVVDSSLEEAAVTGDQPRASHPPTSISPYRRLFSASYHGITPATGSLRDSLVHIHPVTAATDDTAHGTYAAQDSSTHPTGAQEPIDSSETAPSHLVKQIITDELNKLSSSETTTPVYAISDKIVTGTLAQTGMQNASLIELLAANSLSGKLELNAEEMSGEIFFANGQLYRASAAESQGSEAITELLLCKPCGFRFTVGEQSPTANIQSALQPLIANAAAVRDQLSHLERAGLKPQSIIVKTQENLGDNELGLLITKNSNIDPSVQIAIYRRLEKKFTMPQFLGEQPMTKANWVPILFNFYTSGLIEIKAQLSTGEEQLDFLGATKSAVQTFKNTFVRKETGILTYPALLYFLHYEFLRFQSYDWPLSLVIFDMHKISPLAGGGLDLIDQQETLTALQRIAAMKRPLDQLGHFEAINYALLMPNSSVTDANQIAHQIIQALHAAPLSGELEDKMLKLSFGIVNVPHHCTDIESMITLGKNALMQAKSGHYPIMQAKCMD